MSRSIIGYLRVSTAKQGRSGLGLEGQRAALESYARQTGGNILKTYVEVESVRHSSRPELAKALGHARRSGAQLVVAKLDRLARNVAFTAALMESKVDFVCCDIPHANSLTIHILSAVAEDEAKAISRRTKDALAAYKARGGKLGASRPECRNNLTDEGRRRGARIAGDVVSRQAEERYSDLSFIVEWRRAGMTQSAIAERLNSEGQTTAKGKKWRQAQVLRVLKRFGSN
jgi:DNA invertase Pin-like site-specific DNA recombinase